nr:hypothetical protein [Nocardioides convexus]
MPLATTASGLPQGMMFGAAPGHEALLIESRLRDSRRRRRSPGSRADRTKTGREFRTPQGACIVLRRCPFRPVGRASPW